MIVCLCNNISDKDIKAELNNGSNSLRELKHALGVTSHCGACECEVKELVNAMKMNQSKKSISALTLNNIKPPIENNKLVNSLA